MNKPKRYTPGFEDAERVFTHIEKKAKAQAQKEWLKNNIKSEKNKEVQNEIRTNNEKQGDR